MRRGAVTMLKALCVLHVARLHVASQGIDYSTTAMYMCKSDADFRSDGMEQAAQVMGISADDDTCSARNAAMLQRYGHASWHNITCDMVTAHKDAFYEHIVFGTLCCGSIQDADWASTRAKVRCLDSSTMCKAAADFKPTVYTRGSWGSHACLLWDGFLLPMFDGNKANWADEEVASTKWKNDLIPIYRNSPLGENVSDVIRWLGNCCGECGGAFPGKIRCSLSSGARVVVPAPTWAVVAVFAATLAARLSL